MLTRIVNAERKDLAACYYVVPTPRANLRALSLVGDLDTAPDHLIVLEEEAHDVLL